MTDQPKVHWGSYVMLFFAVVVFSGALNKVPPPWNVLDFMTLTGKFGTIAGGKGTFVGSGGTGARAGFLFSLSLFPTVILALGLVKLVDGYGGLAACERLISPLFRPVLGIPGACALTFITSLQSSDGGAAMTKGLYDSGIINDKQRSILVQLIFSGSGTLTNYFSSVGALFVYFTIPVSAPLAAIFICKVLGAVLMRMVVTWNDKSSPQPQE